MILRARGHAAPSQADLAFGRGRGGGRRHLATHFVALLAYDMGLPISFDTGLTLLSAAIAMTLCGLGFALAISRFGGVAGGLLTGAAISAMHYVGMAGLDVPADAIWDWRYVLASVLLGVSLSGLAMHVALRRREIAHYVLGAALFAAAILAMHFTGMSAVRFLPDAWRVAPGPAISLHPGGDGRRYSRLHRGAGAVPGDH